MLVLMDNQTISSSGYIEKKLVIILLNLETKNIDKSLKVIHNFSVTKINETHQYDLDEFA